MGRKRKATADWTEAFLDAVRQGGNIFHACAAVGCSRSNVYQRRDNDEGFATKLSAALEAAKRVEVAAQNVNTVPDLSSFLDGFEKGFAAGYSLASEPLREDLIGLFFEARAAGQIGQLLPKRPAGLTPDASGG